MLERRDPFRELRRMEGTIDRLWRGSGVGRYIEGWAVPLDVVQGADEIVVHATLPGVKPEEIQVNIEEGLLTIKGETRGEHEESNGNYVVRERRAGRFHRALWLPDTVDAERASPGTSTAC